MLSRGPLLADGGDHEVREIDLVDQLDGHLFGDRSRGRWLCWKAENPVRVVGFVTGAAVFSRAAGATTGLGTKGVNKVDYSVTSACIIKRCARLRTPATPDFTISVGGARW